MRHKSHYLRSHKMIFALGKECAARTRQPSVQKLPLTLSNTSSMWLQITQSVGREEAGKRRDLGIIDR